MDLQMIAAPHHAAFVTILALAAWLVSRGLRWSALGHAAWILVLIKLLTPPLFALPAPEGWPAVDGIISRETRIIIAAAWGIGSLAMVGLLFVRGWKFQQLLTTRGAASAEADDRVRDLARSLELRRIPCIRLLDVRTTPLVWGVGPAAVIVFPAALWERSSAVARDAMLVHELSHLRRGDPWVRVLEAVAMTVFWWHPVVWIARRELAACEEECCDAAAVAAFAHPPRAYAESLLEALDFASGSPTMWLATGVRPASAMAQRLTRIMLRTPLRLTRTGKAAVAFVALLALPLDLSPNTPTAPGKPLRKPATESVRVVAATSH